VKLFHNIESFEVKKTLILKETKELLAQELMVAPRVDGLKRK